jgi:hypothetical protein
MNRSDAKEHENICEKDTKMEAELYQQLLFVHDAHLEQTTIIDGLFAKKQGLPSRKPICKL